MKKYWVWMMLAFVIEVSGSSSLVYGRDPFLIYNPQAVMAAKVAAAKKKEPAPLPPPPPPVPPVSNLIKVNGIIWDSTVPYAVFVYNNSKKLVNIGDTFMGIRILEITRKTVVVYDGKKKVSLEVGEQKKI